MSLQKLKKFCTTKIWSHTVIHTEPLICIHALLHAIFNICVCITYPIASQIVFSSLTKPTQVFQ